MKPVRILLADDHSLIIEGLRRILDRYGFKVVGAVADGRSLLRAAARLRPEVIVTDVVMPLLNGIEACRKIHKLLPDCKVVFLSMHSDIAYAVEALQAGASAYVLKTSVSEVLVHAIREALAGRVYVAEPIAAAVKHAMDARSTSHGRGSDGLTERQREVLHLLAEGKAVKEIAALLMISPRTVEFHKYRIMDSLGATSVAELARYAAARGVFG